LSGLLLDTCAVLWIGQGQGLTPVGRKRLSEALDASEPLYVCTLSAWEIGMLVSKGRVSLTSDTLEWIERFMLATGAIWLEPSPTAMVRSSFLPGGLHGDPVDRILVASARETDLVLFTGDKLLLEHGAKGHVRVHAC
jgi:PIN domain nuclease of toxin-antitoxin system